MSEVIDPEVEPQDEPTPDPEPTPEPEPEEPTPEPVAPVDDDPDELPIDPPEDAVDRTVRTRKYRYEVALEPGDGRTIEARIVPYNTPALVADPPFFVPYMEEVIPGAFDNQMRAADKVLLNFEHEPGIRGVIGHAISLVNEGTNFLRATFRVLDNADGNKALQLVNEGLLKGMSVEFMPKKSRKAENGVMQRISAHLDKVSLCRFPAYQGAEVVAVRTEPVLAKIDVPRGNPEIDEKLAALGIQPIQRTSISHAIWNPDPERYTDEEWEAACLVDRGGDSPAKERCDLAVLEPDGSINMSALEPAVSILRRGALHNLSSEMRLGAAQQLVRYYRQALLDPPNTLVGIARGRGISPQKPLRRIAVTQKPWDGSASRYTDEQYQRACLIDRGGNSPAKDRCSVPVLEPDGTLNVNALGAAAAALEGARTPLSDVTSAMRAAAARKLLRYYAMAGKTPPEGLRALAG